MSASGAFVYVQHLLGIGHLKRAATLARALSAQGLRVTLASGGAAVAGLAMDGVDFVQLPPAYAADASFKTLLDENGREVDEAWKRRRGAALLEAWHAAKAQVLVIELYPFGRRQMRFELLPLLEAASAAPRRATIVCSVRDILGAQQNRERQEETLALLGRYFDRVLVHGDPGVVSFEQTFPAAERIARQITYTGYIVDPDDAPSGDAGKGEVIVSAGGGAVGAPILEAAIRARPLCSLKDRTWRILAGNNLPDTEFRRLAQLARAQERVELERSRPDFTTLLANSTLCISQAGYNTLMETIRARARAVVVPFAGGRESEQTLRARCFAARGLLELVEEAALTPQALAAAVDRAARKAKPAPQAIDLDGAGKSAALIGRWTGRRPE